MGVLTTAAVIAVVAGGVAIYKKTQQTQLQNKRDENKLKQKQEKLDKLKENLVKKLDKDSEELRKNAICYYMHDFYLGEDVPTALVDEIKKEYKTIYSLPYIDYLSYHLVGQEIDILDEILTDRLGESATGDFKDKKQKYESMLQKEAKEEAVKKYEELKQKNI